MCEEWCHGYHAAATSNMVSARRTTTRHGIDYSNSTTGNAIRPQFWNHSRYWILSTALGDRDKTGFFTEQINDDDDDLMSLYYDDVGGRGGGRRRMDGLCQL